jgi:hypothetical protein
MKKLSEEEKKHYREVFEEKNSIIEYANGWGWVPIKTKDELERILNSTDYSIRIIDFEPYGNITEFLDKQKSHGPYLIPINIQPKKLIYPIEIKDDGITIYTGSGGYGEVYSEFVKYNALKKYYTWQDDYPCGKF